MNECTEAKKLGKIALILTNRLFCPIGLKKFFEVSVSLINGLISLMYMTMAIQIISGAI